MISLISPIEWAALALGAIGSLIFGICVGVWTTWSSRKKQGD